MQHPAWTYEVATTLRQALAEIERLRAALEFYASPRRYEGANQKPIDGDMYAPKDFPYLWDVMRDGGEIARDALTK